jgi:5-methylcytosine-specific restriction protein A
MADWPYNTARWQRLRRLKLSSSPICEDCERIGIVVPAQAVDHRDPISAGGEPFPELDKLASLCNSCHSAKTARGVEAGAVRTSKPRVRKGCDADGNPLDPTHPWSTKNLSRLTRKDRAVTLLLSYPEVSDDGR